MPYVLPTGRKVQPDQAFVLNDIQYPPNWLRHASEADRTALNITWENDPPPADPGPPTREQLLAYAAQKRRAKEIGGITVNSVPVYTDPESQAKLHAARTAAKEDAGYTVKWKGAGGVFFTLNATQIIAIADAVRAHVQACFDAEEAVANAINATPPTITNYQHIEEASWPT